MNTGGGFINRGGPPRGRGGRGRGDFGQRGDRGGRGGMPMRGMHDVYSKYIDDNIINSVFPASD